MDIDWTVITVKGSRGRQYIHCSDKRVYGRPTSSDAWLTHSETNIMPTTRQSTKRAKSLRSKKTASTPTEATVRTKQRIDFETEGTFWYSAKKGDEKKVLELIDKDETVLNERDDVGATALHIVCLFKHTQLAMELYKRYPERALDRYEKGTEGTNDFDKYTGETALHIAIMKKNVELADYLVTEHPKLLDIEAVGKFFQPAEKKNTSFWNNMWTTEYHKKYSSEQYTCYAGGYPLGFAVLINDEKMVRMLVKNGADMTKKDLCKGNTAMHIALIYGLKDMYKLLSDLWKEQGHELPFHRQTNNENLTALTLVASLGKHDLFEWLWTEQCGKKEQWSYGPISSNLYPLEDVDCISYKPDDPSGVLEIITEKNHSDMLRVNVLNSLVHQKFEKDQMEFNWSRYSSFVYLLVVFFASADVGLGKSLRHALECCLFVYSMVKCVKEGIIILKRLYDRWWSKSHFWWHSNILSFRKYTHGLALICAVVNGLVPQLYGCWGKGCKRHETFVDIVLDSYSIAINVLTPGVHFYSDKNKDELLWIRYTSLALMNIFAWLNFLWYFIMANYNYATFFMAVFETNIASIGMLCAVFVVCFSTVFSVMRVEIEQFGHTADTRFVSHTKKTAAAMLGDYSLDNYHSGANPMFAQLASLFFMFAFTFLILNMLIAKMSETYTEVKENAKYHWGLAMTKFSIDEDRDSKPAKFDDWSPGEKYWITYTTYTEQETADERKDLRKKAKEAKEKYDNQLIEALKADDESSAMVFLDPNYYLAFEDNEDEKKKYTDPDKADENGLTAIHYAARNGCHPRVWSRLLENWTPGREKSWWYWLIISGWRIYDWLHWLIASWWCKRAFSTEEDVKVNDSKKRKRYVEVQESASNKNCKTKATQYPLQ